MAARVAAIWWSGGVHLDRGSGRRSGTSYSTSCARACVVVVCEKINFRFSLASDSAVLDASFSRSALQSARFHALRQADPLIATCCLSCIPLGARASAAAWGNSLGVACKLRISVRRFLRVRRRPADNSRRRNAAVLILTYETRTSERAWTKKPESR